MTRMPIARITWRRLDAPGYDVMRLLRTDAHWTLAGVAAWSDGADACALTYVVSVDAEWRTRSCSIDGFIGARPVTLTIVRDATGVWTLGDTPVRAVDGCDDIDLSFTPATNLLPIRRLALAVGERATVRAAWLRVPELALELLEQRYTRTAETTYDYESDGGAFRRTLTVDGNGLVRDYPGLWSAVPSADETGERGA